MADIFDQLAADEPKTDIFDQIANEPGFLESLGQGFQRGVKTVGTAKDVLFTEAGVQSPQRTAANIARRAEETAKIPGSVGLREFQESTGALDALGTLARNPGVIGELTAESLPISGATLVAGAGGGLIGGVPGAAIGAGTVSGTTEYLLALQDQLAEEGIDLQDEERVAQLIADPEFRSRWREKGVKRGAPIGAFDGVMMGVAGSFIGPVRQAAKESGERMIGAQLRALAKETGVQVAGGMGGEATAQLATGGIDSPQSIIAEGAAEIPFSIAEAVTGVKIRNRARSGAAAAQAAESAGMPATASEIVNQTISEIQDEATGVSTTEEQPAQQATGETLDELITEEPTIPASPPDVAGTTTTEEVINEPVIVEQASDSPATEEASQETQEEVDPLTNEPTIITGSGRPDRARISERNREILGRLASQNLQAAERGNVEQSVENLWEGPIPEQALTTTVPQRVIDENQLQQPAVETAQPQTTNAERTEQREGPLGTDLEGQDAEDQGRIQEEVSVEEVTGGGEIAPVPTIQEDAISQPETAESVLGDEGIRREGELPTVGEGNAQEVPSQESVQEEVTKVYREASPYQALPLIDPNTSADLSSQEIFFAESPELALGQGGNKGIRMEFDRSKLDLSPNRRKPGTDIAIETGQPIELIGLNDQKAYQDALVAIEFNPNEISGAEAKRIQRLLPTLGWRKTKSGDVIRYEKPSSNLETEKPSQTITGSNEEMASEMPVQQTASANAIEAAQAEFTRLATRGTGESPAPSEIDKIVARLKVPEADVQDVAQDVAVKAATSYNPESGASPLTWVNRIAQSTVADYFRKQSAQKRSATSTVSMETPVEEDITIEDTIASRPEAPATDETAIEVARNLTNQLTETEKTILERVVQNRESQASVARSLGLSQSRVSSIQRQALKKLKKQMQERGFSREDISFDEREEFPNFGPGAANILEFLNRPRTVTSTMNRVANEERAKRGELPVLMEAIQSNQETFDMAEAMVEQNPNIGRQIVVGLLEGKKTQVSEIDEAILLYEKIRLMNERAMEADRAADPYETPEMRDAASKRFDELEEQITQLDQATRRSGTIWGRLGQFRQRLMRDDFTFEAMERKARVSKGRPLTAEESEEIRKQAERIAELERKLEEAEAKATERDRVKATDEKVRSLKTEARKKSSKNVDLPTQAKDIAARIKKRVDEGGDVSTLKGLVQQLALNFVRQGIDTRDMLVDAVHAVLLRILPDIDRSTTMDLISGYGDFKPLDKEPAKQTLRQLKGELQQIGKIEDMQRGIAPKKTGVERRTPSAEERRLIKQVNELKKRGGFEVTDPEAQLRSAMDAIKTRLRNQIEDLDNAIASKEPIVTKKGTVQYDEEATALRNQRDALKEQYDQLFPPQPLPEEEQIRRASESLDRQIQQLEADLKEGRLYPGSKPKKLSTPELEAKRARLEALRAERENLRNLDTDRVERQKIAALQAAIDRAQEEIPNRTSGVDTVDTEEVARLKARLAEVRERKRAARLADVEYSEARKEAALLRAIERAQSADLKQKNTPYTADTKRIADLKATLAEIRQARDESLEAVQAKIDKAIERVQESIRSLDKRIQEGNFSTTPREGGVTSDELEALRAERDAMRRLFNELRAAEKPKKSRDEIILQSYKTRALNKIAELQERLAKGDFETRKRTPIKLDKEGEDIEQRLYEEKRKYNEARFKDQLKRRPFMRKLWDESRHVLSTARAIMTSIDLSMIFRQAGFITIGNPTRAIKSLPGTFRALANEQTRRRINKEIWERPNAELYRQSKLAITDPDETSMNKMEEAFMSRWASKIPGVAASERAYTTFLNLIRADTFDTLVETLGRDGAVTQEEAAALANYVNVATGRGNLAGASGAGFTLNSVFFAPRLLWSRLELMAGQPFYRGTMRTRNLILREYVKFLIGITVMYNLALLAGFDVEWDPRSSDFGKIRFGNVRIDPLAGLAQVTTLLSRIFTGEKKTLSGKVQPIRGDKIPYGGEDTYDIAARFVRTKLNPAIGAAIDLSTGKNVVGEEITPGKAAARMVTPLSLQDVVDRFQEFGVPKATALTMLEMVGFGVQNFESKVPQSSAKSE